MDSKQTPINARTKPRRQLPTAVEDVSLAVREHLIWPVEDRLLALEGPGRVLAAGAAIVVAAAIGVGGLVWAASSGSSGSGAPEAAAVSKPLATKGKPAGSGAPAAPTLHGAAPVFKPAKGNGPSEVGGAKAIGGPPTPSSGQATGSAATDTISSSPSRDSAGASASTVDGPSAGPGAIAVARDFAAAFVVYETGGVDAGVRKTFGETATRKLSRALLRRPPRLPADVKVPKAKVVNVVAGPSHAGVYSLSVSLLRVGVTSELRLQMEKTKRDGWQVTNVLG
jgi:hypothetical protein